MTCLSHYAHLVYATQQMFSCVSSSFTTGGLYALIAAHISHLLLNWNDDSFIFRQRINCGESRRNKKNCKNKSPRPPQAIPANIARNIRICKVFLIVLLLVIETQIACVSNTEELCTEDISYTAHICGGISGLITGYIFLTARRYRWVETGLKNILLLCLYTFFIGYIIAQKGTTPSNENCSWIDYQSICQEKCYHKNATAVETMMAQNMNCSVSLCS